MIELRLFLRLFPALLDIGLSGSNSFVRIFVFRFLSSRIQEFLASSFERQNIHFLSHGDVELPPDNLESRISSWSASRNTAREIHSRAVSPRDWRGLARQFGRTLFSTFFAL
jgi:hypothetical protein